VDQNGSIDSGRELFGSGTLMANGRRANNGFEALGELDSNGDARIDARDERFGELLTWADHDQDKIGHGLELQSSTEAGLVSIELAYDRNPMCDARGNCGVERAAFTWREATGELRQGEVVDVHLPCR
jgi:hypothetical protein